MGNTYLNTSAELILDAPERIVHVFISVPEITALTEICIDKGDGWMPYNGNIQVNGVDAQFPVRLQSGENYITFGSPFEGIGVFLKGYDFLNTLDMKVISSMLAGVSGDNRSGEIIVTAPGIITINFNNIATPEYSVVALITTADGSIGIGNVLFNTRTSTSVQVQVYEPGVMRYVITPYR